MDKILLHSLLPNVFSDMGNLHSDIWQQEVHFNKGESYLIEAVSGKGKSSLCSYIYGYREDYSGSIFFDDKNIREIKPKEWDEIRSTKLSLLFQELNLFPELTAIENVLLKNNLTHHKNRSEIEAMFETLGIENKIEQKTEKLSWGQQQRVAIIRCLCQPFDFIFLDEPISHLDDENAKVIANLIITEANKQSAGIITTSIGKQLPIEYSKIYCL